MNADDESGRAAEPSGPAEPAEPVAIPHRELSPDALRGVIEAFVLREGTDYGEREFSLDQKVAHVRGQLDRGEAQVLFDPDTETVHIAVVRTCRIR